MCNPLIGHRKFKDFELLQSALHRRKCEFKFTIRCRKHRDVFYGTLYINDEDKNFNQRLEELTKYAERYFKKFKEEPLG